MAQKAKRLMRQLTEERRIKDVADVQALVKELTAGLIQEYLIQKRTEGNAPDNAKGSFPQMEKARKQ